MRTRAQRIRISGRGMQGKFFDDSADYAIRRRGVRKKPLFHAAEESEKLCREDVHGYVIFRTEFTQPGTLNHGVVLANHGIWNAFSDDHLDQTESLAVQLVQQIQLIRAHSG